ncbi:MAG: hypothetical protein K9M11_03625 [Candidatus Pacebacteria bacterium]|nr:hypothetical protein [Candidatus Paceibacterota bacterium]
MDPNVKRNFSFPNSDQYTDRNNTDPNILNDTNTGGDGNQLSEPRKTINIMDALAGAKKDEGEAQTVRTYQSDIANTIKNDNVSMIKVALSEKKRQERRGGLDDTLEEGNKNLYLVIGAIVAFIVIAGFIAGFIFLQSQNNTKVVQNEQQKVQPILYTEMVSVLNIDEININNLIKLIESDREALMDLGSMKAIVLTTGSSTSERQITSIDFFNVLNSRAPDGLLRSLDPNFLLGVYAYSPREMFAVFHVNSYDSAFAGMLEWEPNVESDIGDIFINKKDRIGRNIGSLAGSNTTINLTSSSTEDGTTSKSTTSATNDSPFGVFSQRKFVDKILSNKDARVLVDSNGKESMLYTFLDKETLVIATSEKSLKEIIFRLTTGRIVR